MRVAAAYIRVSTDDQLEYSPDSQLRLIRDYAVRSGYSIPEEYVFVDEGLSGRRAEKRPAFMRMIAMAKTVPKPFDAIIIWKFSRFARSRQDSIVYKSMLRKQLGIEVLSVSETLGDNGLSLLIEALIEAMDEYYSVNLGEEVRRGMTEKARRGEPLSIPPFGYKLENKCLMIVPDEAEIVKLVFHDFNEGRSTSDIARMLNVLGVRSHRGGAIEARTIEYWLNNPVYIGKIRWTPTGKINRDFNNPNTIVSDGGHQPIIDLPLWESVQSRLALNANARSRTNAPSHWLTGVMRCGMCGHAMVNCRGYFYCSGKSRGKCYGVGGLKAELASELVSAGILELTGEPFPHIITYRGGGNDKLLRRARQRLERVEEAYRSGIDTLEEYKTNKIRISEEIAALSAYVSAPEPQLFSSDDVANLFLSPKISNGKKNAILRAVTDSIKVYKDKIIIEVVI